MKQSELTKMDPAIKRRCKSELAVFVELNFGQLEMFWFPALSTDELISWWRSQQNISAFTSDPVALYILPGEIYVARSQELVEFWHDEFHRPDSCKAWINNEDHSCLITSDRRLVTDQAFPAERVAATRRQLSRYLEQGQVILPHEL